MKKLPILCTALLCTALVGCSNKAEPAPIPVPSEKAPEPETTIPFEEEVVETTEDVSLGEDFGFEETLNKKDGLYEISGHALFTFNGKSFFNLTLTSLDNKETGLIDLSNGEIPSYILDYIDNIYLDLSFDNEELKSWKIVDKKTNESLADNSQEALEKHFHPEKEYEVVEMGMVGDKLYLSELKFNTLYTYDIELNEENCYIAPTFINDTENPLLEIHTKFDANDDFEDEIIAQKASNTIVKFAMGYSKEGKMYIFVQPIDFDVFLANNSNDYITLDSYDVNDMIDYHFEDYVYNNTDKEYVLEVISDIVPEPEIIHLLPGEIAECTWMNDTKIIEIN